MTLRLASAYRAWSGVGIGNNPTAPLVGSGDQYLQVDDELWYAAGLPDALRRWLTLNPPDDHYDIVRDDLESWVAFPLSGWQFVGRLCAFGTDSLGRPSYYAHGRGWLAREWTDPEYDPGAWIGNANAFDAPWKDRPPHVPVAPPDPRTCAIAWGSILENKDHSASANLLLAHLYQAVAKGHAVVCLAPLDEFRIGRPLCHLVGFARAALPFRIKKLAKVRVYSDSPAFFFQQEIHLLALTEDHKDDARNASVLLEWKDGVVRGPAADSRYTAYARAVVSRARSHPEALLRFSAVAGKRLGRYLGADTLPRTPGEPTTQASALTIEADEAAIRTVVPIVYNLAVASLANGLDDSLLTDKLYRKARRAMAEIEWSELVSEDDWNRVSLPTLMDVALRPAPTRDSQRLRHLVRLRLLASRQTLDDVLTAWWRPDAVHAGELFALMPREQIRRAGTTLVSRMKIEELLRTLPPPAVAEVLADEARGAALVRFAGTAPLPDQWRTPELLEPPVAVAGRLFAAVANSPDLNIVPVWRDWLDAWAVILATAADVSYDLGRALLRVQPSTRSRQVTLAYGELHTRLALKGLPDGETDRGPGLMDALVKSATTFDERLAIAQQCLAGESIFLNTHLPTTWVLNVARDVPRDALCRWLDGRLQTRSRTAVTDELLKAHWWLRWRTGSSATADARALNAIAWLKATGHHRQLEEWTQVMLDLAGRLSGDVMQEIRRASPPLLPWIRGFENEQIDDVVARAIDLGALAELAESVPGSDYARIEARATAQDSPLVAGLPAGTSPRSARRRPE